MTKLSLLVHHLMMKFWQNGQTGNDSGKKQQRKQIMLSGSLA
jgi:hypothetical protein